MSLDDKGTTAQPKPKYQLRSNTQSFEPISLNSNLRNGTIKCLQRHCHLVQLLLGIHVQVTLHERYIKVHLKGLINGVRMLSHLLSHLHHIFRCKP
jgi:hypothetical protein